MKIFENINEYGINIDRENRVIEYDPSHQDNVDTSVENNPIINKQIVNGVEVWSIFQRKQMTDGTKGDGNPLIYALKGEGDWKFADGHRELIEQQIGAVIDKFLQEHQVGVTLLMPSTNYLNTYIAKLLQSKNENVVILGDVLRKATVDEVEGSIESIKMMVNMSQQKFDETFLKDRLELMRKTKGGIFTRHLIPGPLRNAISGVIKINRAKKDANAKFINGKDILLIDDTISRGQSIKEACDILKEEYMPNTITVLTLLSALN